MWNEKMAIRAKCREIDPDALFVQGAAQNRAKLICRGCPVRTECLAEALDNRIEFGVWGGMTERERRTLLGPWAQGGVPDRGTGACGGHTEEVHRLRPSRPIHLVRPRFFRGRTGLSGMSQGRPGYPNDTCVTHHGRDGPDWVRPAVV